MLHLTDCGDSIAVDGRCLQYNIPDVGKFISRAKIKFASMLSQNAFYSMEMALVANTFPFRMRKFLRVYDNVFNSILPRMKKDVLLTGTMATFTSNSKLFDDFGLKTMRP